MPSQTNQNFLHSIYRSLTAYDLLALTVVLMIFGHIIHFFTPDLLWLRVPDRIMVPIFILLIGFNSGHKFGWLVWAGAITLTVLHYVIHEDLHINILGTFILIKFLLEPLVKFILKDKFLFWATNICIAVSSPLIEFFLEYGAIGFTLAIAGWLNRNREETSEIVSSSDFFIFAWISYVIYTFLTFGFSGPQTSIILLGAGISMWLLYNFNDLLMNSIRRRPKDIIEKTVRFIGRKSLEIYIVHVVLFQIIYYLAVKNLI